MNRDGRARPRLVHMTTTDMSLDWLLGPQLLAFKAAGYEVIGMSAPGPHVANLNAMGIEHVVMANFTRSNDPASDVKAFFDLVRELRRLRPDIVHTHNPKPGILGRVAARIARVPLVVNTQHGLYAQPEDRRRRRWPVYAVERLAAAFGDVELVQNSEDATTLVQRLKVPERKVRVLGNGVDLRRFDPTAVTADARARLRDEWGVDDGDVVFGAVGRLVIEKGMVEMFAAHRKLLKDGLPVRLVVVGPLEPGKSDGLDEAAVEAARADGVIFLGQRDDMPELYSAMDVFVTATYREGFPRAAMEAAAMGLPIVATDIRGCRQVVDNGVTGVLVRVRDADALASGMRALVEDTARREAMRAAARPRALAEFDVQRVIAMTLDAYRSPVGRRRRRARCGSGGIGAASER
jgi:glycosyltransferase involved in cell wall biosynthesis